VTVRTIDFSELYRIDVQSLNPAKHLTEEFDLYSVPAYERGTSDRVTGAEIGSTKAIVRPGDTLLCKIVPHIRRGWVVPEAVSARQLGSGEWIVLRHKDADPGYLRHLVMGDSFHREFMQTVAGVGDR
jgi:type I restriction enzyme S subunit